MHHILAEPLVISSIRSIILYGIPRKTATRSSPVKFAGLSSMVTSAFCLPIRFMLLLLSTLTPGDSFNISKAEFPWALKLF